MTIHSAAPPAAGSSLLLTVNVVDTGQTECTEYRISTSTNLPFGGPKTGGSAEVSETTGGVQVASTKRVFTGVAPPTRPVDLEYNSARGVNPWTKNSKPAINVRTWLPN